MSVLIVVVVVVVALVAGVAGWQLGRHGNRALRRAVNSAHTDQLTGLPDRVVVSRVLEEARAKHLPLTVAVCDVNGLHSINDRLGHVAGDQMLQAVSNKLLELLPIEGDGVVARTGGDEFWVVTSSTPERLLESYTPVANGLGDTVSVGIASSPANGDPFVAIECADIGMFVCKQQHLSAVVYDGKMGHPGGTGVDLPSRIRNRRSGD